MIRILLTTFFVPLILTILFFIKDKLLGKRKIVLSANCNPQEFSIINLLLSFIMISSVLFELYFTLSIFKIWNSNNAPFIFSRILVYTFLGVMFYLIIYQHNINRYRKIVFIVYAIFFSIDIMGNLYDARGHFYFFTPENIIQGEIPKCHIGILQSLILLLFRSELASPGKLINNGIGIEYFVGAVIIVWIASTLALGKGWCSWVCFWGGWDEAFSSMCKKQKKTLNHNFIWIPFAILFVILLMSLLFSTPTYCWWLCPFKAVTEGHDISTSLIIIQTVIFITIFIALIIVFPLITQKRTQCAFFCPFGAFQSIVDKLNIFSMRIDKNKCINCKLCINECPIMAKNEQSIKNGTSGFTCMKCGKCLDICPQNAIAFHLKCLPKEGKAGKVVSITSRYIFLYLSFTILGTIGGSETIDGLMRLFKIINFAN